MITQKQAEKILGKRVLIEEERYNSLLREVKVLEFTPSFKYVKFEYLSGAIFWKGVEDFTVVEILSDEQLPEK